MSQLKKNFLDLVENDPERAVSKKKQRAGLNNLSKACSSYVNNNLILTLGITISDALKLKEGWYLEVDDSGPDGQTLQFQYPSSTNLNNYIRPSVKIELGARSEHWPVSKYVIQSYVKTALKEIISESEVEAKRTFWEKATILHQYAHLPKDKTLPPRISRHYYDFFCLLNSNIKADALAEQDLLERVAIHKSIYFASTWANYGAARKGILKLSPIPTVVNDLKRDFEIMQDMFFGKIPEWSEILKIISEFEIEFNQRQKYDEISLNG
jgi:hypothetical protein